MSSMSLRREGGRSATTASLRRARRDLVEIGFGSGFNVPFHPTTVTTVAAGRFSSRRIAMTPPCPPGRCAPSPTPLPLWANCGGFSSLGASCISSYMGWPQTNGSGAGNTASSPVQKRVFGGRHLTRPIVDLLTAAVFTITELDVFYQKPAPKFGAAYSLGTALSP
jgi:hypothetical protein